MTKTPTNGSGRKKNKKRFVLDAIHNLRKHPYKGIHVVWSGFNAAFRKYYEEDPRAYLDHLVETDVIVTQPVRGGIIIFDAEDKPKGYVDQRQHSSKVLATILATGK